LGLESSLLIVAKRPLTRENKDRGFLYLVKFIIAKGTFMDLLRILIAILLPPLGVFLQVGIGKHFWINIILTLLGYIPGIVHAVWVIAKK